MWCDSLWQTERMRPLFHKASHRLEGTLRRGLSAACHQIYTRMESGANYATSYVCMAGFKNVHTEQ